MGSTATPFRALAPFKSPKTSLYDGNIVRRGVTDGYYMHHRGNIVRRGVTDMHHRVFHQLCKNLHWWRTLRNVMAHSLVAYTAQCRGTFVGGVHCAMSWHIRWWRTLRNVVAHSLVAYTAQCHGTFVGGVYCAMSWHIRWSRILRNVMAHSLVAYTVQCHGTFVGGIYCAMSWHIRWSRILRNVMAHSKPHSPSTVQDDHGWFNIATYFYALQSLLVY